MLLLLIGGSVYGVRSMLHTAPKSLLTETVTRGVVEIKVVENGTIEPIRQVDVKSKVGGRVAALLVDEGFRVRRGQPVASIDPQEINTEVAALQAQLAGAQARLSSAQHNIVFQSAQTSTAIAQYEHNVAAAQARLQQAQEEAGAQPALTSQTIAMARANLDAARAGLHAQQESVNLLVKSTHPQAADSARSAYDEALAQANNDKLLLSRQQRLAARGYIAEQQVDVARTQAAISGARLDEAKSRLDRVDQISRIEEANARAQLASAQGQVHQMEAALSQAQASVLPITSMRQVENAQAAYRQALDQLAAARAGRSQDSMRRDEADSAAADVQQIRNQLQEKLVNQGDTTLLSPTDGIVTHRYVEQGELITSAISSFSAGSPVFQISDESVMLVKINVNEVDIEKVHPGIPVEVTVDANRGTVFHGVVRKVSPAAAQPAAGAGTSQSVIRFPVEVLIAHPDARLRPGMSARCAIIVDRQTNVLRVPVDCTHGEGSSAEVTIVTSRLVQGKPVEQTAARRVTLGLRGDDYVEVKSGVRAGEKVRPNPYSGPERAKMEIRGG